ncbi:hypothetical protein M514_03276 [Trichuris suis]|uniref:Uncharacterized protein n=1 Tax=Trichuris suis TaxID=68888 RepID=A0A085NL42_9BILA|nr:hypothetical protein M513_03276 [Trichuris suis]KFD70188.1 hypothetical protein M514_03276 [Trichuris suis]
MAKVASSLQLTAILMLLLLEITFGQPPYLAGCRNDAIQQWRNGYGSEAKRAVSDSWPDVKKSDILLRFGKRLPPDSAQRWQGEDFQNVLLRFG